MYCLNGLQSTPIKERKSNFDRQPVKEYAISNIPAKKNTLKLRLTYIYLYEYCWAECF